MLKEENRCRMTDLDLFVEHMAGRVVWLGKITKAEYAAALERGRVKFCMPGPYGDWIRGEVAMGEIRRLDRVNAMFKGER